MSNRTLLVYYSKTGNTRKVAQKIAENLECDLEEVDETGKTIDTVYPSEYDLVVIGSPVHGFRASEPIQEFVKQNKDVLPRISIFLTFNLWSARTISGLEKIAGKKCIASEKFKDKDVKQNQIDSKVNAYTEAILKS